MPQNLMHAAGFILGHRRNPATNAVEPDEPEGTGFSVYFISDAGFVHFYLITADHVVPGGGPWFLEATRYDGSIIAPPIPLTDWWRPLQNVDLAICTLPDTVHKLGLPTIGIVNQSWPSELIAKVGLGQTVHYVGLLDPFGQPMARSGSVGNLYVKIEPVPDYQYSYRGHLVDCRSYGGFSGSPVFLESQMTKWEPTMIDQSLAIGIPPQFRQVAFAEHAYMNHLLGMFTAHLDDKRFDKDGGGGLVRQASRHGVGIVLPVEVILKGLNCEKLRMDRKRKDDAAKAKDHGPPIAGARREPKRDMDERVSLHPLTGEEALKGLLETPPPPEDVS